MKRSHSFFVISIVCLVGLVFACGGEANSEKAKKNEALVIESKEVIDETERKMWSFSDLKKQISIQNFQTYLKASKRGKGINYFAENNNKCYFLAQSIFKEGTTSRSTIYRHNLYDQNGSVLLKNKELVGCFGVLGKTIIEFKEHDLYGFLNTETGLLVPAEFDYLYKSSIVHFDAFGQKGDSLFGIKANGKLMAVSYEKYKPVLLALIKEQFETQEIKTILPWISVDNLNPDIEENDYYFPTLFCKPSFLNHFGDKEKLEFIDVRNDEFKLKLIASRSKENHTINVLEMMRYYGESRSSTQYEYNVSVTDKNGTGITSKTIFNWNDYSIQLTNALAKPHVKLINDSIIEIKEFCREEQNYTDDGKLIVKTSLINPYEGFTRYRFLKIENSGKIIPYKKGNYSMASTIRLTKEYFKGSFSRVASMEEKNEIPEVLEEESYLEADWLFVFDHLNEIDLKRMRNEVYARYGLIFKDTELSAYFKQFSWYKPTKYNVDGYVTPLEKENIAFIKKMEKELSRNVSVYIKKQVMRYAFAG
jgi:hypothetical protein